METFYTMIMFDAFSNVTKDPGSGFLHWCKINIPCTRRGQVPEAHGHSDGELYGVQMRDFENLYVCACLKRR